MEQKSREKEQEKPRSNARIKKHDNRSGENERSKRRSMRIKIRKGKKEDMQNLERRKKVTFTYQNQNQRFIDAATRRQKSYRQEVRNIVETAESKAFHSCFIDCIVRISAVLFLPLN